MLSLLSPPLGCSTATRFSFPGCCCIPLLLVRNTLCQFVCSPTPRASTPRPRATPARPGFPSVAYGAVNVVLLACAQVNPHFEEGAGLSEGRNADGGRHANVRRQSMRNGDGEPGRCFLNAQGVALATA